MPDAENGAVEDPPQEEPGNVRDWLIDQFKSDSFQFILVGIFVFIVLAIVFVLIFSVVFDRQPWQFQGAVRTLLALAGASLITVFLSRSKTTLNSTIGIVLIGALIISTEDILRFSLLFSGSDRTFEEFFIRETPRTSGQQSQSSGGKEDVDISVLIVNRLAAEELIANDPRTELEVSTIVSQFLKLERNDRIISQLEQRAADRLFRAIVDGHFQEWNFRFGSQQKFQSDLAFLRSIGLISYVYGTPQETMEVTELGRDLSVYINTPLSTAAAGASEPRRTPITLGATARLNIDADGSWFVFEIERPDTYEINVTSEVIDPTLRLFADSDSDLLAEDDDGGFDLNSRLVTYLSPGQYFLNVRDYDLGQGPAAIDIRSYVPPETVGLEIGDGATLANVGLDGARFAFAVRQSGDYLIEARSESIDPVIELRQSQDFRSAQIANAAYPEEDSEGVTRMTVRLNAGEFGLLVYDDFGEPGPVTVSITEAAAGVVDP